LADNVSGLTRVCVIILCPRFATPVNGLQIGRFLMEPEALQKPADRPDFEQVFNAMPGLCLVLDPAFTIVAQNDEHARATLTEGGRIVGQHVFAAFPDNPEDSGASGVSRIRGSLLKVLKTREPDHLAMLRYDVKPPVGPFVTRYWSVTNIPLLGKDGFVEWILIRAEEVTGQVRADRTF
jgi:PAS domain-containing protein